MTWFVIQCPFCLHPLNVSNLHIGHVVACPICNNSLTIPAHQQQVDLAEFSENIEDPSSQSARCNARQRGTHTTAWLILTIVLIAISALVTLYYIKKSNNNNELQGDLVDLLITLNRCTVASEEASFWTIEEPGTDIASDASSSSTKIHLLAQQKDEAITQKWGASRKSLGQINPKKSNAYTILSEGTKDLLRSRLRNNHMRLKIEKEQLYAKIAAEEYSKAKPILPEVIDRSTAKGERDYEIEQRMLPLRSAAAKAALEATIAKRYEKELERLIYSCSKRYHAEIIETVAEWEREFKAIP